MKTIREVLEKLLKAYEPAINLNYWKGKPLDQAHSEILKIVGGCVPKKKDEGNPNGVFYPDAPAYNQCRQQMLDNLRGLR